MNTGTEDQNMGTSPPVTHLAMIMDGNGRWAKQRGLPRSAGHQAGTDTARDIVTACRRIGIQYLTLYAFSQENWSRPQEEVQFIFDLLLRFLRQEQKTLIENSIRLNIIGNWADLPFPVRKGIQHTLDKTRVCDQMVLNLALSYSGRDEIVRACRAIVSDNIPAREVTEETLRRYLWTGSQPDPDLIIRTSGELRLSNYLIFQAAYSEFYFTHTLWPDFSEQELRQALEDFMHRKRRFGGIESQ